MNNVFDERLPEEREPHDEENIDILPGSLPRWREVLRQHRLSRWLLLVAAVLVIGALVVTNLLIFQARTPSPGTQPALAPPAGPVGQPVSVETQANGVAATMQITAGPYFLGELLRVEFSITSSSRAFRLDPLQPQPTTCALSFGFRAFVVTMTGGGNPGDTNLQRTLAANFGSGCGGFPIGMIPISPHHTSSFFTYIVLTSSGRITLSAQTGLTQMGSQFYPPNSLDPLAGHWPSIQITVQAGIPSDRVINGQQRGTQVTIDAPSAVRSQLLYAYTTDCVYNGEQASTSASMGPLASQIRASPYTRDDSNLLTSLTLELPPCNGELPQKNPAETFVKWVYVIGAVGYTVFFGTVQN